MAGYIVGFICVKRGLVVELDGGQHDDLTYDDQRTSRLEELGLRVIPFWDPDVLKQPDEVAKSIYRALSGG